MLDHELPLTEARTARPECSAERAQEIERLVDRFYEVAREDSLLGPVFTAHVGDWGRHLSTMRDFWGTVAYRDGRYAGRPFEAHQRLEGLTIAHFERWLTLWDRVVDEVVASDVDGYLKEMAHRMGASIAHRMGMGDLGTVRVN